MISLLTSESSETGRGRVITRRRGASVGRGLARSLWVVVGIASRPDPSRSGRSCLSANGGQSVGVVYWSTTWGSVPACSRLLGQHHSVRRKRDPSFWVGTPRRPSVRRALQACAPVRFLAIAYPTSSGVSRGLTIYLIVFASLLAVCQSSTAEHNARSLAVGLAMCVLRSLRRRGIIAPASTASLSSNRAARSLVSPSATMRHVVHSSCDHASPPLLTTSCAAE